MVHLGDTASFLRVVRIYAKKGEENCYQKREEDVETGPVRSGGKTRREGDRLGQGMAWYGIWGRFPLPLGHFVQVTVQSTPPAQLHTMALGKLDEPK